MNLQYTTASGYIRTIKDIGEGVKSDNKNYITYKAANGRTYHIWGSNVVNDRLVDDVVTVETKSNWCRLLGIEAKYID